MRPSSKPRSRGKSGNRRNHVGSILNRVFDSSGPDGKVRGTPQQIIDKYIALARDAQLAGDRVGAENHLQHSEHYARLLGDAQREIAGRREALENSRQAQAVAQASAREQAEHLEAQPELAVDATDELFPARAGGKTLVQTPESGKQESRRTRNRSSRRGSGGNQILPVAVESDSDPVLVVSTPESDDSSGDALI